MFKFTTLDPASLLRQLNEFALQIWARLNGGIGEKEIKDGGVNEANLADGIITDAKIDRLSANRVRITNADVDRETVNRLIVRSADIEDGYIKDLGAGHIDAKDMDIVNLHAESIQVGTINGYQISQGAIEGGPDGHIAPGTITGENIDYIEADVVKGGDLVLGGGVNGKTYNGRVVMRRADDTEYGIIDKQGIVYKDAFGNEAMTMKDSGITFGSNKVRKFAATSRTGVGIFAV